MARSRSLPAHTRAVMREVLTHWSQERRTIKQGFLALAISTVVGMAAGIVLGSMNGLLEQLPGLLVLVPAAIPTTVEMARARKPCLIVRRSWDQCVSTSRITARVCAGSDRDRAMSQAA